MQKIKNQLLYTQNIKTIDKLLRIKINQNIAIKYLPQLSPQTKYLLLRKGSKELQQSVLMDITNKQLPENYTIGQFATNILQKIINFGIKPEQPIYKYELLDYLTLNQKILLFNQHHHKYFNNNIKEQILQQIEKNQDFCIKCSNLFKWLSYQDQKDYDSYLPIIINIVLQKQRGILSYRTIKYISIQYDKIIKFQLDNIKLFLDLYREYVILFLESKNSRNRILLKLKLNEQLNLNYSLLKIEEDAKKYNNLDQLDNIQFYLKCQLNQEWLLQQIIQKKVINHSHKTQIVILINHIIQQGFEQYYITLFEQIMDAFEPEEVFYEELFNIFKFLLTIKDYPEMVLVQLFRIFADKHILFDPDEFSNIILLINQFQDVNIEDQDKSYQPSIFDEVRDYYLRNSLQVDKDVHQIFIKKTINKLN